MPDSPKVFTIMRQPDIEIYLKDADHNDISNWLTTAIGPCSDWQQKGVEALRSVSLSLRLPSGS